MASPFKHNPPETPQRTPARRPPSRTARATPSASRLSPGTRASPGTRSSPGARSPTRRLTSSFNALTIGVDTTATVDNFVIFRFTPTMVQAGFPYQPEPVCEVSVNDPRIGVDLSWDVLWPSGNLDQEGEAMQRMQVHLELVLQFVFSQLLVTVKTQRCVVLQPTFLPSPVKRVFADVFLTHYRTNSLQFLPAAVCSTVGAGVRAALVVDVDWHETTVTPVYDLREMVPQSRTTKGLQHCQAVSDLFLSDYNDDDELPLDHLVDQVTARLDTDTRAEMLHNMIITVGSTSDPKRAENLQKNFSRKSILAALGKHKYRLISTLGPWAGAALYVSSIGWYLVQEERARLPAEMSKERYQSGERWIIN